MTGCARLAAAAFGLAILAAGAAHAQGSDGGPAVFRQCLERQWNAAQARGVQRPLFERAVAGLEPDMRLVATQRGGQAEFERPLWDYVAGKVSDARITEGRRLLASNATLLSRVEAAYGVDGPVLVALWASESHFGRVMGDRPILRTAATLACHGRRQEFFAREFVVALEIVARGDATLERLRGSWAGAFGHMQFLPTTFQAYGVDFDGDGRRDLIGSTADALASAANKLKQVGWQAGRRWGYEVVLPAGFDHRLAASDRRMPVAEWQRLGLARADGQAFPHGADIANLLVPTGARGPAFLVLENFHVLRRYNTSDAYAISIGHLADRIRGGGPFVRPWPRDIRPLSLAERIELQERLTTMGFDTGGTEGRIGARTRDAVRGFQVRAGLLPDGFPTHDVLAALRRPLPR